MNLTIVQQAYLTIPIYDFLQKTFDNLIRKTGYFTNYESAIYLNPENTEFSNSYKDVYQKLVNILGVFLVGRFINLSMK